VGNVLGTRHQFSDNLIYKRRSNYGGENRRLKTIYAEECFKAEIINEALEKMA